MDADGRRCVGATLCGRPLEEIGTAQGPSPTVIF